MRLSSNNVMMAVVALVAIAALVIVCFAAVATQKAEAIIHTCVNDNDNGLVGDIVYGGQQYSVRYCDNVNLNRV